MHLSARMAAPDGGKMKGKLKGQIMRTAYAPRRLDGRWQTAVGFKARWDMQTANVPWRKISRGGQPLRTEVGREA